MLNIDLRYCWNNGSLQVEDAFSAHYKVTVQQGLTTLLGASGEGKSTLLHLLGGFLEGEGSIVYFDKELIALPPDQRPITSLFQSDNLFPQLTVWQNIAIGLANNMKLNDEQFNAVEWALNRTELLSYQGKKPSELSGGQAQRVALARAVARAVYSPAHQKRSILLLDEPFSALDPSLRMNMLLLVNELTEQLGLTTLLVSHLPDDVKRVGGQLLLIESGQIVLQDDASILSKAQYPAALEKYLQ